jgi:hypothetical protein
MGEIYILSYPILIAILDNYKYTLDHIRVTKICVHAEGAVSTTHVAAFMITFVSLRLEPQILEDVACVL